MNTGKWIAPWLILILAALAGCDDRGAQKSTQLQQDSQKPAAEVSEETPGEEPMSESEPTDPSGTVQISDSLWIMQPRGSRQCEGGGISVEQSRGKLTQNGIAVIESRCGVRTDRMYPSVCGGATGDILLHRIKSDMLDAALELGFDPVGNVPYTFSSCKVRGGSGPTDR